MVMINPLKTCAVTGHRTLYKDFDRDKLKNVFLKLIEQKINTFLVGMAIGFDTECFKVLEEIRKEKEIYIIGCIPCKNQDYKFNLSQKKEYERLKKEADDLILVSENYSTYCMQKRNRFMVDNCFVLVSYLRKNTGGTFYTVKYAEKVGIPIINI